MLNEKTRKNANRKAQVTIKILILLFAGIFLLAQEASAVTWDGGGATNNYSEAANWDTNSVPTSGTVIFDGTSTKDCVIDINISIGSFEINSGYTGTITQGSSNITVASNFAQSGGTFTGGSGTLDFDASFLLNGGNFTATSGNLFLGGNFNAPSFTIGSGATFAHNNGTIIVVGRGGTFDVNTTANFNNLTLELPGLFGVGVASGDTVVVSGTLLLVDGRTGGSGKIQSVGGMTALSTFDGGGGTVEIAGTAARTITFESGARVPGLILNAPNATVTTTGSGTITFDAAVDVQSINDFSNAAASFQFTNVVTMSGGKISQGSGAMTFANLYTQTGGNFAGGSGNINFETSATLSGGVFTATSGNLSFGGNFNGQSFNIGSGVNFNHNNGTITGVGRGGTLDVDGSETFNNFTLNLPGSFGIGIPSGDTIIVSGNLNFNDGQIGGGGKIRALGDFTIGSGFDGGGIEFEFAGSNIQTYAHSGGVMPTGIWTLDKTGGTVNLASDLLLNNTTHGFNFNGGTITTNGFTVNLGTRSVTSGGGYVIGKLVRTINSLGAKNFDVGGASGYSPANVNVTALGTNPTILSVEAVEGVHPDSPNPPQTLRKYWTFTENGNITANLTFQYAKNDEPGFALERELIMRQYAPAGSSFNTAAATHDIFTNTAALNNPVSDFTDWTMFKDPAVSNLTNVGGRAATDAGSGIARAVVSITDEDGFTREKRTDKNGDFNFANIQIGKTYQINVSHENYSFFSPTRIISVSKAINDLNFTAENAVSNGGKFFIEGKISNKNGAGIAGIVVELSGGSLAMPTYAETDKNGGYKFENVKAGDTYIITPLDKRFVFAEPSKIVYLNNSAGGVDFKILNEN